MSETCRSSQHCSYSASNVVWRYPERRPALTVEARSLVTPKSTTDGCAIPERRNATERVLLLDLQLLKLTQQYHRN
jgi:hypothetical protein